MHDLVGVKNHEAQSVYKTALHRRQREREHVASEASFLVVRQKFYVTKHLVTLAVTSIRVTSFDLNNHR
jgi:hypothetical protein